MEEQLHEWKSTERIAQYLEQVRLDLLENNQASLVALNIALDRNYGFILPIKNHLSSIDYQNLIQYLELQLVEYGYRVNRRSEKEILLQASVRSRVNGKQLFGTIKLIKKAHELRLLVTPYIDKSYNKALLRKDLINVLFC